MILIIAEKPSLARNIAVGIGDANMRKRDGYLEGNGYLISWAFGHLFSLCDVETYRPSPDGTGKWSLDNIPCFPDKFLFELRRKERSKTADEGVKRQFGILKSLCLREDVDMIVNAGDADREGEIIIRLCIENALKDEQAAGKKTFKRLWLPDQTPQTVKKALSELKDESEYDMLANEGFARTYIDWLYGVNLTRYASLRTGVLLRVGRVIVPIVKAIYDRDMAIRNFVPGKYLALQSSESTGGETVELISKSRFEENEREAAENRCALYNQTGAVVRSVKRKKDKLSPGKLYSLSKLQNVLGKKYKMSMEDSLEIVQKLYEQGYLTYPRTNSEYLATAEKEKTAQILENCRKMGYPVKMREDKSVFDDGKIESHSALTPTYRIPDPAKLSEKEKQVYSTVFRRFIAVFCSEPCVVIKSEIEIAVGELETFSLKGVVIEEPGWTKYDDRQGKDRILPALKKGDSVHICFKPVEKETAPPKRYTIETLNNYLKNPFKEEKAAAKGGSANGTAAREIMESEGEDDAEEYRAIFEGLELGTEATRTGIIENAVKSRYIELKKDVYYILPDGEFLIESLERMQISMDKYKTCELGRALKKVYRGIITVEDSVNLAKDSIIEIFEKGKEKNDIGCFGDVVGTCPICSSPVKRRRDFYGCEGYKEKGCKFSVNTFICGKTISVDILRQLLKNGKTETLDGFVSKKSGKTFRAALKLDAQWKVVFDFVKTSENPTGQSFVPESFSFDGSVPSTNSSSLAGSSSSVGLFCPKCGKILLKGKTAYGCSGWKNGCDFRLPFPDDGGERAAGQTEGAVDRTKFI